MSFGVDPRNPLEYTGVSYFLVPCVSINRAPLTSDYNFPINTIWRVGPSPTGAPPTTGTLGDQWIMINKTGSVTQGNFNAQWVMFAGTGGDILDIQTDTGLVSPVAGIINLFGGTGITVDGSGQTATVNATGGGYKWQVITAATKQILINEAYFANNAGTLVFTLPAVAAVGDSFRISGMQGNWQIAANAGQSIQVGNIATTVTTGTITSTALGDSIHVVCKVANTGWQTVDNPVGALLIT